FPGPPPGPSPAIPPSGTGPAGPGRPALPSRDELTKAWGDEVLPGLRPAVKVYVAGGRFVSVDESAAVYALPDQGLLERSRPLKGEMEAALAARFGRPVPLRLVLDGDAAPVAVPPAAESGADPDEDDPASYDLD